MLLMRKPFLPAALLLLALTACTQDDPAPEVATVAANTTVAAPSSQAIDDFFTTFTDQWVAGNPNQAITE